MSARRAGPCLAIALAAMVACMTGLGSVLAAAPSAAAPATTGLLAGEVPIEAVEVDLYRGIVHVRTDPAAVSVTYGAGVVTWEEFHPDAGPPAARPLSGALLAVKTSGSTATVGAPSVRDLVILDLVVPAQAAVRIHVVHYGDVTVQAVQGEVEAGVFQGRIALLDLPGPALAHVGRDGDIRVRLTASPSRRPMSFTTYEGDIDLEVPASIAPRLRAEAIQGDVRSELPSPPGARDAPGDSEIRVTTARGVINVRTLH